MKKAHVMSDNYYSAAAVNYLNVALQMLEEARKAFSIVELEKAKAILSQIKDKEVTQ